uniref:Uncharacterized protein n=1 Tax=Escherichia coli TaxID=562 RepID=A0A3G4RXI6_ECOLX|nr:hypothetical protein D0362_00225 [Escherichia coli]
MHSIHMKSGRDTTHLKTTRRLSLKHWSTKTVIFSAESWPCFKLSQRQAQAKTPFLDNLIQMLTFDIGLSILHLLFCRLKIPCVFLLPDLQNDRAATVPAAP